MYNSTSQHLPLLQPPLSYTAPELAGNGMQGADITLTSSADVFSLGEACFSDPVCKILSCRWPPHSMLLLRAHHGSAFGTPWTPSLPPLLG